MTDGSVIDPPKFKRIRIFVHKKEWKKVIQGSSTDRKTKLSNKKYGFVRPTECLSNIFVEHFRLISDKYRNQTFSNTSLSNFFVKRIVSNFLSTNVVK